MSALRTSATIVFFERLYCRTLWAQSCTVRVLTCLMGALVKLALSIVNFYYANHAQAATSLHSIVLISFCDRAFTDGISVGVVE